jgi:phosphate transport system permease protein
LSLGGDRMLNKIKKNKNIESDFNRVIQDLTKEGILKVKASTFPFDSVKPFRESDVKIRKLTEDSRKSDIRNYLIEQIFQLCGVIIIILLISILGFLVIKGYPAIKEIGVKEFLTGTRWMPSSPIEKGFGALSFILSSILVTLGALLIGVPWGIFTAIFISEIAPHKLKEILKPVVEILSIFPSVVLGFIALVLIGPKISALFHLQNGLTGLTGSIILGIMILPTIVSITEDALKSVPKSYREASYALGATKWETIRHVVLPTSSSGIVAAIMLGFGRAVGETMAVLMATGNALSMPVTQIFKIPLPTLMQSLRTLTANIAIEGSDVAWGSLHYHALFVIGLILFVITFIVNVIADIMLNKFQAVNRND